MKGGDLFFLPAFIIIGIFLTNRNAAQVMSSISGINDDGVESGELVESLVGGNVTLQCTGTATDVYWSKGRHNVTNDDRHHVDTAIISDEESEQSVNSLYISNVTLKEAGKYRCVFLLEEEKVERTILLNVKSSPRLLLVSNSSNAVVGGEAIISCTFESNPAPSVLWFKDKTPIDENKRFKVMSSNESTLYLSKLSVDNATLKDNGTYECRAENSVGVSSDVGSPHLLVHTLPSIKWNLTRSLGPQEIQLNWEVHENNAKIVSVEVWIADDLQESSATMWDSYAPSVTSVVLDDGIVDAAKGGGQTLAVWLKLKTESNHEVVSSQRNITMLQQVPIFVPSPSFRGASLDALTVGWSKPSKQLVSYVSFYLLSMVEVKTGANQQVKQEVPTNSYRFVNLKPGTNYNFSVAACMGVYESHERDCAPFSATVTGTTLFNFPDMVEDVVVKCSHNGYSGWSVEVTWKPSDKAKEEGPVNHYKLELKSIAKYVNEDGQQRYEDEKREENVSANFTSYTFNDASANTHYTVKVFAGINHMYSKGLSAQCIMPVWIPRQYNLRWWISSPQPSEGNGEEQAALLKLPVPAISQRNGTICCYRIVVVKLAADAEESLLPSPSDMPLSSHQQAHESDQTEAYVAEAYSRVKDRYLLLGDNKTVEDLGTTDDGCESCPLPSSPTLSPSPRPYPISTPLPGGPNAEGLRGVRSPELSPSIVDGTLSPDSNYTGYLILTVQSEKGAPMHSYSSYFNKLRPLVKQSPIDTNIPDDPGQAETLTLMALIGVLSLLVIVTLVLCCAILFYQRRNKHFDDEFVFNNHESSLTGSLGKIFRTLRKSNALVSPPSIDVKPIAKENLVQTYLDNIKDSELGFRREYEALPEKFIDRSSRCSELTENFPKNRYPDIKAYDQTRVKLSSTNSKSDYINANYVCGYKERKKFICAQGPMDGTVDDFWRMIVDQGCGICVMLTNIEENGKVKCIKYWPEAGQPKTFGNITVRLVKEKSYSDYIVRTLRAEWMVQTSLSSSNIGSNSDLNGKGVVGGEGSTSTNSSIASKSTSEEMKYHEVQQYHYLVWRDFVAPEHPVGILAFLKRMNEAYSTDKGPLLVHCSAGVGRTGTLVALDSLVMELDDESQASVYNLICDLRRQRNFLVQSLKQYVFIHRALMEYAQFGTTEQTHKQLREAYVTHTKQVQQQVSEPLLQTQFELLNKVIEERKSFAIATSEENKTRNRYDYVLPYDSNRVILHPVSGKPLNTYINASFVSGFDLDEHFIVTQDPLENTLSDFWRMVYEQDIATIVMLSELGSGDDLCMKYWPEDDEEATHDMIKVKLVTSESYPKFSSRVFQITNSKSGDTRQVTQFQYIGWSGAMGEVPVGTYGIMEVINRVHTHLLTNLSAGMPSPVLIHCSAGADRCSIYVCLNNSLRQLRREGRVDVFQIARKIRSQRQYMLQEITQYEFCYKALIEYIDSKGIDSI